MAVTVRYQTAPRGILNVTKVRQALARAQYQYAQYVASLYLQSTEGFSSRHGPVEAYPKWRTRQDGLSRINIYIRGAWFDPYRYLDFGAERKILMTEDYVPKTTPGFVGTKPGRGGPVRTRSGGFIYLKEPKELKAREFTVAIAKHIKHSGSLEFGTYADWMRDALAAHFHLQRSSYRTVR